MGISYKDIKKGSQWKAAIGLSSSQFMNLSVLFGQTYESIHEVSLEQGASNLKKALYLSTYEDCLFFVLFALKNGLTYESLGLVFGMDGSNAQRNFEKYLTVLEKALEGKGVLPRRSFRSAEEFRAYFQGQQELIIDASEQAVQRPKGRQAQEAAYSGKKKTY
jgi:hypothetical protein